MDVETKINQTENNIEESKEENNKPAITLDMTIGDVIQNYPSVVEILLGAGVHCVGCHVAHWETLEQGLSGHGKTEEEVNSILKAMNDSIIQEEIKGDDFSISEKALKEIKDNLKEDQFLRIEVVTGGCSGMSYSLSLNSDSKENDHIEEIGGIKIVADKESFKLIQGSKLDYLDTFEEKGFRFVNPNAKKGCGCGKSFGV